MHNVRRGGHTAPAPHIRAPQALYPDRQQTLDPAPGLTPRKPRVQRRDHHARLHERRDRESARGRVALWGQRHLRPREDETRDGGERQERPEVPRRAAVPRRRRRPRGEPEPA